MSMQNHPVEPHASPLTGSDVTPARIEAATRLIATTVNPLRIIAFGSWARGQHRPDSDWDVAVILDANSDFQAARHPYTILQGISMSMDTLTVEWERHVRFRDSINSVHHDIDKEAIVLYQRTFDGSASRLTAA